MLSDEVIDKVIERLIRRIEKVNTYTLKQIAKTIKKMSTLAPSDTRKLIEIMNYGGDYEKILKKLAKMSEMNEKEIYEIFDEVAKSDYQFARQYYKYRDRKYIPYEFNKQLKDQVQAIASITAEEYRNISRTLAFSRKGADGKVIYSEIGQTYQDVIDEGIISLQQGKDTFNQQMRKIIKELSKSGIKSVNWESGTSRRLEYAVRMHLQEGIRNLHNEMQMQIAKEIDADGIEISVHNNPAPDHQDAQGRQFTINKYDENGVLIKQGEFEKLQETGIAKDYKDKEIDLHKHLKNGDSALTHRPISQYNCYHYTFSIVLGVNEPQYTNEQLEKINKRNLKGFEYGGKHYTMYEGTQLQRKIENAIRKEKDTQIMAKESGQDDLVQKSEKNINTLLNEYLKVSKESGLPTKMERLRVDGYKQAN